MAKIDNFDAFQCRKQHSETTGLIHETYNGLR